MILLIHIFLLSQRMKMHVLLSALFVQKLKYSRKKWRREKRYIKNDFLNYYVISSSWWFFKQESEMKYYVCEILLLTCGLSHFTTQVQGTRLIRRLEYIIAERNIIIVYRLQNYLIIKICSTVWLIYKWCDIAVGILKKLV